MLLLFFYCRSAKKAGLTSKKPDSFNGLPNSGYEKDIKQSFVGNGCYEKAELKAADENLDDCSQNSACSDFICFIDDISTLAKQASDGLSSLTKLARQIEQLAGDAFASVKDEGDRNQEVVAATEEIRTLASRNAETIQETRDAFHVLCNRIEMALGLRN